MHTINFMNICALNGIFENCLGIPGSKEHIIPNAVGGQLTNSNCICSNCNKKSGSLWDAPLTKQFNILCVLFFIKRDRGNVPNETIQDNDGEKLIITANGGVHPKKPQFSEQELSDGRIVIDIQSSNKKEALEILKALSKKKGYEYNAEDIVRSERLIDGDLNISPCFDLVGPEVGRSLIKTIYLFAITNGINKNELKNAWHYLSVNPSPQCFCPYYNHDPVIERPKEKPIHVIHIVGDQSEKILYGYIEILGLFKYIVILNDNYDKENVSFTHIIDPTTGNILNSPIDFNLEKESVFHYLKPSAAASGFDNWLMDNFSSYMEQWIRVGQENRINILLQEATLHYPL